MTKKRTAKITSRLAVCMVAPVLGVAGAQAGEQAATESVSAQQGVPFAQVEVVGPMGPGPAGPMGPQGGAPYAGAPWGGPHGAGPVAGGGPPPGYGPPGPHGMMGPGMMQGQGGPSGSMQGGRAFGMQSVMRALHLPNLSEEQRGQLRSIAQELRKKHWDLKGAMMEESDKLAELWAADPVDANAVGEAYGRYFDLQRQWIVSSIETQAQVEGVLTAEQKQWLRSGPPMPAMPPMMPPGMMPGMPGGAGAGAAAPPLGGAQQPAKK